MDRVRRDEVAEALAAYLRGEMGHRDLVAVCQRIEKEMRPLSDRDSYLWMLLMKVTIEGSLGPSFLMVEITKIVWEELCRHLAFLKSDLERRAWVVDVERESHDKSSPRMNRFIRWNSLCVLAGCGMAFLTSWWVIPMVLVISLVLSQHPFLNWITLTREEKRRLKDRETFDPFFGQEDWLAHQHLLDSFGLPEYDSVPFEMPPNGLKPSRFLGIPVHFFMDAAIFVVMIPLFVISALTVWPLLLIGSWFSKKKGSGGQLESA